MSTPTTTPGDKAPLLRANPACVLVFNANDPSGASGLAADVSAMASVGAHALPVMTGAYARDTARIFDYFALDDEAIGEQARAVLEDIEIQAIKLGFAGSPDNLGLVAGLAADYPDVPLIAHMPDLSWWNADQIERYHDAFAALIMPQTSVLIGSHSTLWRWLLPDWHATHPPGARDLALAAGSLGANITLVSGMAGPQRSFENTLATPHTVLATETFQRIDRAFAGAGDTLSAALSALIASDCEPTEAFAEALSYLDRSLTGGFRPGMGHIIPDRLFWAQPTPPDADPDATPADSFSSSRPQETFQT